MSLIDEALKRARQEAALQDAAQREAQFRRVPVYTPPPPARSRGGLLMAGAGLCAGIALVIGLAFAAGWLPAGRSDGEAARAPVREELRAAAGTAAPEPRIIEGVEETEETETQETPPRGPAPVPTAAPTPLPTPLRTEPLPAPRQETAPLPAPEPAAAAELPAEPLPEEATTQATPQATPAPEAAPPVATPAPVTTVSYVRQVPVPGGGTLELSGIAFSAERPVALINGKPWVPGEVIQGFTIVAVEPGRVQLDGHGQKVFVSLK